MTGGFHPDYPDFEGDSDQLYFEAFNSLLDGDLVPLAAFIRAGNPISGDLAKLLEAAIEGRGPVKLQAVRTRKSRIPESKIIDSIIRKATVGIEIEQRLMRDPGLKMEAVIEDVRGLKDVGLVNGRTIGRTAAFDALAMVRRCLGGQLEQMPYRDYVIAAVGNAFPDWDGKSPHPKRRVRTNL